jgi:2-aminoadipate transaminase
MDIQVDRESQIPVYIQIRNQLRERILRGDLPVGIRLPPEREMARLVGVSRTTVVSAYDELMAEGLVEARVGRGTTVVEPTPQLQDEHVPAQPMAWPAHFSTLGERLQRSTASELLALHQLSMRPGMTSFSLALPDPSLMPVKRLQQAWEAVLNRAGSEIIGYTPLQGIAPLREFIAERLALRGVQTDPEGVIIVNGFQQGLDLLIRLLTETGDAVVTESPCYFGALQAFQARGLRVIGIPVDSDGMKVEQLEFHLARYRPRLIYTVPTYQNPSSVTMSQERREKLIALAQRYQVPIIEDDPFSELYFHEPPPPPIKALDRTGHVIYLGTFSKDLGPGWKVGYLVAPHPVVKMALRLRRASDPRSGTASQLIVLEFCERGWLDEHLEILRRTYAPRCQTMQTSFQRFLPRAAQWQEPAGGMFFWLELPRGISAHDLLIEAGKSGVVFVPGGLMYPSNPRQDVCRLSFSAVDHKDIEEGIKILGSALRQLTRREPKRAAEETIPGPIV